jgi:enterochelin esterase-like enzyme
VIKAVRVGAPVRIAVLPFALAAFLVIGGLGLFRYLDGYWLYRGFAPPQDPAYVKTSGIEQTIKVASPALGGRRQEVDVFLPPGYAAHPTERYPVLYLLHGEPGRPGAFLATVRMGVVEDELVALHRAQPIILVMPYGSTGTFTDKEWANGVRQNEGWGTFVTRDVVNAIDRRYRTIRAGWARGIGGLSEGGYGAINLAIQNPGEFGLVESWSGYELADPIVSIFGKGQAPLHANSPLETLPAAAPALRRAHTYFWLYSGKDDSFLDQNQAFAAMLGAYHLPYRFRAVNGGHNWALWRGNAAVSYLAASDHLQSDAA